MAKQPAAWQNERSRKSNGESHLAGVLLVVVLWLSGGVVALAQNTPPTLQSVVPRGGRQGEVVELLLDGINLNDAFEIVFNAPGLRAVIHGNDLLPNHRRPPREGDTAAFIEDRATRNRVRARVEVAPDLKPGIYRFRIRTPLGISNLLPFAVTPFPEASETQVNDTPEQAQEIALPVTVRGEISQRGDVDHFRFQARAGQELVFAVEAASLGSSLNSRLTLLNEQGEVLAQSDSSRRDALVVHRVEEKGGYVVAVSDAQLGGGGSHFYRLQAGEFRYVESFFPLGVQAGTSSTIRLRGANLGEHATWEVRAEAAEGTGEDRLNVRIPEALNSFQVAVGPYPEALEQEPNDAKDRAQPVSVPVTVNGRIDSGGDDPTTGQEDVDLYRFQARAGRPLVLEVEADRLGSPLDSVIEILDLQGRPVSRATIRCLAQTEIVLRDHNSISSGLRLENWDDLAINDYVMVGQEVLQVIALPRSPDDDVVFRSFMGRRQAQLDTSSEAHALGTPVYKVRIAPSGVEFPPNGMPVFHLDYRNDDGGPAYGRDSRLTFTAPEDGEYLVRIRDVRGMGGEDYAYRLTIREPDPDFRLRFGSLMASGQFGRNVPVREHFNLPAGGRIPVNVLVERIDGFEGTVDVEMPGLPPGVRGGRGRIDPGSDSTVVLLEADEEAAFDPFPLKIVARSRIEGKDVVRGLEWEQEIRMVAPSQVSDLRVRLDRPRLEIVPGGQARLTVEVDRLDGFSNRVPVDVRNLPHGVRVLDVGLNGILITEEENRRTFTLYAEPWVEPQQRSFLAVGRVETTSFVPLEYASPSVELVVVPSQAQAGVPSEE